MRWDLGLAIGAAITMTLGNVVALRQTTLKRLMAYSSIAQAGYVIAAVAVSHAATSAMSAVVFYGAAYALMNLGAFVVIAGIERTKGSDGIGTLDGFGRAAPIEGACMLLALLSLAGIPPLAGFAGKILLLQSMMQGGMAWLAVIAVANMVVGLYYYAMLAGRLYFEVAPPAGVALPTNISGRAALAAVTIGTTMLGLWPSFALTWTSGIAASP